MSTLITDTITSQPITAPPTRHTTDQTTTMTATISTDTYRRTARRLIDQYAPTARRACDITDWPDELPDGDLVIYDRASEQICADINFEHGPADRAYLTIPPNYIPPLQREPFVSIDEPTAFSDAGAVIYEIVELIDWIVMSPHPELTDRRELAGLLERLHQQYGYPLEIIQTELIEMAQHRGDLSQTPQR